MARFKKVIFSLLAVCLLGGCQQANRGWKGEGKVKILSTTAQVDALVSEIGGERVESLILIQGDLDPHSYEIVKGDSEKLQRADLIFYNGLGLEHGAGLASILKNSPKALAIGEEIQKSYPEKILMKEGVIDPHIWMDISLWQNGIPSVVNALSEQDPEGAPYYKERGKILEEKMTLAHQEIYATLQKIPSNQRYLVTSHDAFHYFTRSYLAEPGESDWTTRFAAPEGLAPEGQLSSRDIQNVIEYLKKRRVCVLFPESNVNRDSIRKIALAGKELGLEIQVCSDPLYGDSMSGLAYLEMMNKNAATIAKHLWNGQ